MKDHVLLPAASELDKVVAVYPPILNEENIRSIVGLVPDEWLAAENGPPEKQREIYCQYILTRVNLSKGFVKEAKHARESLI